MLPRETVVKSFSLLIFQEVSDRNDCEMSNKQKYPLRLIPTNMNYA